MSLSNPESENLVKQRENLFKTKLNLKESMQDPKLSLILADSYAKRFTINNLDCTFMLILIQERNHVKS